MKWLLIILLLFCSSKAQVKQHSKHRQIKDTLVVPAIRSDWQRPQLLEIFRKIEHGIQTSALDEYKDELGAMVSIAIGSGERGYFSMNQAVSVLASYFSGRRSISFEFSRIHEKGPAPYATGRFIYVQKGNRESAQVYVSLTRQNARWVISQFNIY